VIVNLSGTGVMEEEYRAAGFAPLHVGNGVASLKTSCLGTTLKLRRLMQEIRPDLIHTSHFSANYHGRLAAIGLGIPVVVHCHNIKRERKASRRLADSLLSFVTHT
jgi:UDP-N-acetylglucosamine:LPS N-acetylglucosamine transferase